MLGLEEDQPIEHKMLSNAIETAQQKIEGINFNRRKNVLQYDDVMNKQREIIYAERYKVLNGDNLKDNYTKMIESISDSIVTTYCKESPHPDNWDWTALIAYAESILLPKGAIKKDELDFDTINPETLKDIIHSHAIKRYEDQENEFGSEILREVERRILIRAVDEKWMDHIDAMEQLKYGIGLRAYGQRDPVVEYRAEGFDMFDEMIRNIQMDSVKMLMNVKKQNADGKRTQVANPINAIHGDTVKQPKKREADKVGRNDECPCGSGKKYKKCCGA